MHASLNKMAVAAVFLSASLLAPVAEAHMIMANPIPYGYQTIDNSPLTGSNYPCKVTSDPATFYSTDGIDNTYAAGSSQTLSFKGSAVHGGGSCQLAITNDMQPSASTDWRVILSIESGCPTTDGTTAGSYNWTVPAELEPGQYSFAWTWISKLAGQPEYYMNCAPITVTAATGSSAKARRDTSSYPELFVANLDAINSCKTTPSTDPVYPDPGADVEKLLTGGTPAFATITQSGCVPLSQTQGNAALPVATAGGSGGSGSGSGSAASSASGSAATSTAADSSSAAIATSSSTSIPGGSFATATQAPSPSATTFATSTAAASSSDGTSSSTPSLAVIPVTPILPSSLTGSAQATTQASSSSVVSSAPATSATATTSSVASSTASAEPTTSVSSTATSTTASSAAPTATGSGSTNSTGSTGSGSASVKSGTCTDEGMFNCVGSNYQQCASGSWTTMQALPGGTTCTQGESTGLWARTARVGSLFRRVPRGQMARL